MRKIEDRHLKTLLPILREFHNETEDFGDFQLRNSLKSYFTPIIITYSALLVISCSSNLFMVSHIVRNRKRCSKSMTVTHSMLFGNCLNDVVIKNLLVLPFSVLILLTLHWTQGAFICYTFPLLQDSCFYATSITFLLIFYNRYKMATKVGLLGNLNEICEHTFGLPAFWSLIVAWVISFIGVFPYTIYIEFIDLSLFLPIEEGNGFCVVNLDGNIQEYIRCLFISFYVIPIALVAYFHARTTTLMKSWPGYESINFEINLSTLSRSSRGHLCSRGSADESLVQSNVNDGTRNEIDLSNERKQSNELTTQSSILSEKGTQRAMLIMFAVHIVCLLPINILRMSKHVVIETHENSFAFDVVFVIFVWIQFSSTAIIPLVFYLWTSGSKVFRNVSHHHSSQSPHHTESNCNSSLVNNSEQNTVVKGAD